MSYQRRDLCPRRRGERLTFESCEPRRLLTVGDANGDGAFDEADFVLAMQTGLYNSQQPANGDAEGDWNSSGFFDSGDLVYAFTKAVYRTSTIPPEQLINSLATLAGENDGVELFYQPDSGDLVVTSLVPITAVHLRSQSNRFDSSFDARVFDLSTSQDLFQLVVKGTQVVWFREALPTGLSHDEVRQDLLVSGAMFGGGPLGRVSLSNDTELPANLPADPDVPLNRAGFVPLADAEVVMSYDVSTGDLSLQTLGAKIVAFELTSENGIFTGVDTHNYKTGFFDVSNRNKIFRLVVNGTEHMEFPGLLAPGLSIEDLTTEIQYAASQASGGPIRMAIVDAPLAAVGASCSAVRIIGDANEDGRFDSADLVLVFQGGQYRDNKLGNSDWSHGDWNCDGEFDSADLVSAMQTGFADSELAVLAVAHVESSKQNAFGGDAN
ncbi:MAG: hypothetical protein KDA92_04775 [Planctomycetales bacterium]|nr:hypothetical protein [Planctomycetales bacterium]MCA9166452.1 hypothetical protein [Planctomycetales bacterium]